MNTARRHSAQGDLAMPQPEGVHLRMPQAVYDDVRAIGPTDLKVLYWQPQSWWVQSDHNPARRVKVKSQRRAQSDLDAALKALVLEGEAAYRARFAFQPDEDATHWIRTPVQLKSALEDMGCDVRGMYGDRLYRLARSKGIANRVWDLAWSAFESHRRTRPYITEADDARVRDTAQLMLDHAELGPAMTGGLSEVSVLWRREDDPDTLLRARFNKLRVRRIFDLQPIGNWRGRDVDTAISDAIDQHDYGIDRVLLQEGFRHLVGFVEEGRIFGWNAEGESAAVLADERELLKKIAEAGDAEWIWIFVQLRNDTFGQERAPVVAPRSHRPAGRIWDEAAIKIEAGLQEFRRLREVFSLEKPWALVDDVRELVDADVRSRLKREIV